MSETLLQRAMRAAEVRPADSVLAEIGDYLGREFLPEGFTVTVYCQYSIVHESLLWHVRVRHGADSADAPVNSREEIVKAVVACRDLIMLKTIEEFPK